jgi:hypothetical protein
MSRCKNSTKLSTPDADLAAWCAALVPDTVDKVPVGWMTVNSLSEKLGKSRNTVSAQISAAVREGRAEVQKFRILTARGAYPVPHYRLK